jgi:hypothetical protein
MEEVFKLADSKNNVYELNLNVARISPVLSKMITFAQDNDATDETFPLPSIFTPEECKKVIEYMTYCYENQIVFNEHDTNITDYDEKFLEMEEGKLKNPELVTKLFKLAEYLELDILMSLAGRAIVKTLKNHDITKIKEFFEIKEDFTNEEIETFESYNKWSTLEQLKIK